MCFSWPDDLCSDPPDGHIKRKFIWKLVHPPTLLQGPWQGNKITSFIRTFANDNSVLQNQVWSNQLLSHIFSIRLKISKALFVTDTDAFFICLLLFSSNLPPKKMPWSWETNKIKRVSWYNLQASVPYKSCTKLGHGTRTLCNITISVTLLQNVTSECNIIM